MKLSYSFIISFFLLLGSQVIGQPVINSSTSINGNVGINVSISGSGFNIISANNIVFFGTRRAVVNSGNTTNLSVKVPIGATFGPISIVNTSNNLVGYSSQFFSPTFNCNLGNTTQTDIAAKVDFGAGLGPSSIAVGDVDGDGKSDIIVCNEMSNTVSVFRNIGTDSIISLASKIDFNTGLKPTSLVIADINGDGKLDITTANDSSNNVSILLNLSTIGTINFATKVDFVVGLNPSSLAICDIDGDGKLDLAVNNFNNNNVSVLRNIGSVSLVNFATKLDFNTGSGPKSIAIGDLDGNGKIDLAITNWFDSSVSILRNTSSVGFPSFASKTDFLTGPNPIYCAIGDLDGDNKLDLSIANYSGNSISLLRNTSSIGSILFSPKINFTVGLNPRSIAIGEINGKLPLAIGKPDLVITNFSGNSVSILSNTGSLGSLSFATKVDFTTGSGPNSLSLGDIDGDGKLDIVTANKNSGSISIMRNTPNLPTAPIKLISLSPNTGVYGSTVSISGTGFNLIPSNNVLFFGATKGVVTSSTSNSLSAVVPTGASYAPLTITNTITNFSASSYQLFQPVFSPNKGSITLFDIEQKVDFFTDSTENPKTIISKDLDGDGKPDIIAAYSGNTSLSISLFRNISTIGNWGLASKINISTGALNDASSVCSGDINGDGKPDIVVTNGAASSISVFLNTSTVGNLSFAPKVDFLTGSSPTSAVICDLDGDGKLDIATCNVGVSTVSIFRNTSSNSVISFDSKVDISIGINPYSIDFGDFDGDGKLDLATADQNGLYSILRNTGNSGMISFATSFSYAIGLNSNSIALGDIDGDNKLDIAVSNAGSNTLTILRNTSSYGIISFASPVNYSTGLSPRSVTLGDINGDGKPDLSVTNSGSNSISIYRNTCITGGISFAPKIDFTTGLGPNSAVVSDLDGDGKQDLATVNYTSKTISILRNNPKYSTITVVDSLSLFNSCLGKTSLPKSIIVSGVDLTSNLYIVAPSGFEISTSFGTGYDDSLILIPSSGIINNTLIFIRLTSQASGNPTGNLSCISQGANTKNIPLSGIVKANSTTTNIISICPSNLPYNWNGRSYTSGAIDTVYLINATGCDSVAILNLSIKSKSTSTSHINVCSSVLPYNWNGRSYTANTSDTVYLINAAGCDSVTILNLSIKSKSTSSSYINVCSNVLPFYWNGRSYTSSAIDTVYLINAVGCDSVTILNLSIKSKSSSISTVRICPSNLPYSWNGRSYSTSVVDSVILVNAIGCDSLCVLNLVIKQVSTSINFLNICDNELPYNWNGLTFTIAGSQTKTGLLNSEGCDSSATLNLSVYPLPNISDINGDSSVKRLDTISYSVIGASGSVYNWSFKNAIVISGIGSNIIQLKWTIVGLDTLSVIETTSQGCVGSPKILLVNINPGTGINKINNVSSLEVFPNPFNETIKITFLNTQVLDKVILFNMLGHEICSTNNNEMDVSAVKPGLYLIQIIDTNGETYIKKLIKN